MAVQTPSTNRANRKSATPRKSTASARKLDAATIDPERRRALIAEAAYLRAERRGFVPGHAEEDWLTAEAEVDTALAMGADRVVQ
jgi:hypothetical protein